MCVSNIGHKKLPQVGSVYKVQGKKAYLLDFENNTPHRSSCIGSVCFLDDKENLSPRRVRISSLGPQVDMPVNKKDWPIKSLFAILYCDITVAVDSHYTLNMHDKKNNHAKLKLLQTRCYGYILDKKRSFSKYVEMFNEKNLLHRRVIRYASNSRGAKQRKNKFNSVELATLPRNIVECPSAQADNLLTKRNAIYRLEYTDGYVNHLGRTLTQYEHFDYRLEPTPVYVNTLNTITEYSYSHGQLVKKWLGLNEKESYIIEFFDGEEYFPNASRRDEKYYIKPHAWPELYRGRIGGDAEAKALRGETNKKGLRYRKWLATHPKFIGAMCGGHYKLGALKIKCEKCSAARYIAWNTSR